MSAAATAATKAKDAALAKIADIKTQIKNKSKYSEFNICFKIHYLMQGRIGPSGNRKIPDELHSNEFTGLCSRYSRTPF